MKGYHAEIQHVLDRVHGHPGPGPRVRVEVVDPMESPHQGPPVQQAMDQEEVHLPPQRNEEEQGHEPPRVLPQAEKREPAVGKPPEVQDLVGGPDRTPREAAAEDVVVGLIAEEVLLAVRRKPLGMVFPAITVEPQGVEYQMVPAEDEPHQPQVAQKHEGDPTQSELHGLTERRLEQEPAHQRQADEEGVDRPEEAGIAEQPSEKAERSNRPGQKWSVPNRVGRPPVALLVPRTELLTAGGEIAFVHRRPPRDRNGEIIAEEPTQCQPPPCPGLLPALCVFVSRGMNTAFLVGSALLGVTDYLDGLIARKFNRNPTWARRWTPSPSFW